MEIEIIPTEKGKVVLKTFMLYPYPISINETAWNDAVDEAIHFLEEHKIKDPNNIKKQFKKADTL